MTNSLALNNILIWSLQIGFLVALGAALPVLLRLKLPGVRLAYLQFVLAACLLLPLIRSWKQDVISGTVAVSTTIVAVASRPVAKHFSIPTASAILFLITAGIVIRLGLLFFGFWRLRRYRNLSRPLEPGSAWGAEADLRISDEINSPVTFGFRKPVILLPATFTKLSEAMQEAILCHEVLHVRRGDWLFTAAEEFIRSAFWFHPGIWWLLGEIQLMREQAVDRLVVEMTKSRDSYIDALLVIAGATHLDVAPAPLFLRKRHLKQRVFSILKEVHMSRSKSISALAAGIGLLAASCWFVTGAMPLQAAPQVVADAAGVAVDTGGAQLMHRMPVAYPDRAIAKGIHGTVVVQVKLDAAGNVSDAAVLSGPEELRKSVLQSVLAWHFTSDAASATRQIAISFELPKNEPPQATTAGPGVVRSAPAAVAAGVPASVRQVGPAEPMVLKTITIVGLADPQRAELLARLPVHEGDTFSNAALREVSQAVRALDEHLGLMWAIDAGAITLRISTPDARTNAMPPPPPPSADDSSAPTQPGQRPIRVGAAVSMANLVFQNPPVYPALAKSAGVQGTVKFDATIGTDGHIKDLRLVSGPPMLVQSALQSAKDWVYKPTLLNGSPVEVLTTIEVNFTLSQ